jgi:hypothetical protein
MILFENNLPHVWINWQVNGLKKYLYLKYEVWEIIYIENFNLKPYLLPLGSNIWWIIVPSKNIEYPPITFAWFSDELGTGCHKSV